MSTGTGFDASVLHRARREAALFRAEWLMLLHDGTVAPNDVVREAAEPDAQPLLRLSIRQMLLAQEGWGRKTAEAVIGKVMAVTEGRMGPRQTALGWLLDRKSGGRRFAAWLDAFEPKAGPAWNGFPHARRGN